MIWLWLSWCSCADSGTPERWMLHHWVWDSTGACPWTSETTSRAWWLQTCFNLARASWKHAGDMGVLKLIWHSRIFLLRMTAVGSRPHTGAVDRCGCGFRHNAKPVYKAYKHVGKSLYKCVKLHRDKTVMIWKQRFGWYFCDSFSICYSPWDRWEEELRQEIIRKIQTWGILAPCRSLCTDMRRTRTLCANVWQHGL